MQDKPDVVDLLAALAALLKNDVAPALEGRLNLQVRIAANCVQIIRRELLHRSADEEAELARLEKLLGRTGTLKELNEELCRQISQGSMNPDAESLLDHLWQTTLAKVRIDQPDYPTYARVSR